MRWLPGSCKSSLLNKAWRGQMKEYYSYSKFIIYVGMSVYTVYYTNLEKKDTLNILYLLYGVHVKPVLAIKISGHFLKVYTAWWDAITTS